MIKLKKISNIYNLNSS